jgi:hypothetical protein
MEVKKGIYEHFKGNRPILIGEQSSHDGNPRTQIAEQSSHNGNRYEVIAVAKHSETHEDMVVYQNVTDKNKIWVRPLAMFCEEVELDGKKVPRFKYVGK